MLQYVLLLILLIILLQYNSLLPPLTKFLMVSCLVCKMLVFFGTAIKALNLVNVFLVLGILERNSIASIVYHLGCPDNKLPIG